MQISRAAAPGANCQFAREMGFRAGCERRRLFVPDMNPANLFTTTNGIGDPVQGVATNTVNSLNSCLQQDIYQNVSHSLCHVNSLLATNLDFDLVSKARAVSGL